MALVDTSAIYNFVNMKEVEKLGLKVKGDK